MLASHKIVTGTSNALLQLREQSNHEWYDKVCFTGVSSYTEQLPTDHKVTDSKFSPSTTDTSHTV